MPISNTELERAFSAMRRVLTDWHKSLSTKTIDDLLLIKQEGDPVLAFKTGPAVKAWLLSCKWRLGKRKEKKKGRDGSGGEREDEEGDEGGDGMEDEPDEENAGEEEEVEEMDVVGDENMEFDEDDFEVIEDDLVEPGVSGDDSEEGEFITIEDDE